MTAPLHAPGVQRIGRWATGARRIARRRCARLCSRRLDAVGAGLTDASSVATLGTRPEKPVAGLPEVPVARNTWRKPVTSLLVLSLSKDTSAHTNGPARRIILRQAQDEVLAWPPGLGAAVARKISRKPLKTLIPRPGLRPLRRAVGPVWAIRAGSPGASSPATLGTRLDKLVAGRPGVAVARKISRQRLKTMIPRPGSRPLRPAVGAIGAVRAGSPDMSSSATLGTGLDKLVAGRPGVAVARNRQRGGPETLDACLLSSPRKRGSSALARARAPDRQLRPSPPWMPAFAGMTTLAVAVARKFSRKPSKTLIQRPGPLPRHDSRSSPGIRIRFMLWRLGRLAANRKWRRISLKTLETDSEMAGPTTLTRPGSTRSARSPG